MYQHVFRHSLISAALAVSISLTACSSDSDNPTDHEIIDPEPTDPVVSLSGKVADGYLNGAIVCLDLNLNKLCDADEPTVNSTAGGLYSLQATQQQIDTYPVVVKVIANVTIDEDNPDVAVTQEYTLTAPAGKGAFVSPLTTMVQTQIEATGKTAEVIEGEILASMGQDASAVSLFDDYVAGESNDTDPNQASYETMHQIAQVTATTLANNIAAIQTEIDAGNIDLDLSVVFDSLIAIIVQEIIEQLEVITTEVETATEFDADKIAAAIDATVDTETIEESVAVVEATSNTTATSNIQDFFTSGFYWMWAQFASWGNELEKGAVIDIAGTISDIAEDYDFTAATPGTWLTGTDDGDLYLLSTGWEAVTGRGESFDGLAVTYDTTSGTATMSGVYEGTMTIDNVTEASLAGLNIKQYFANSSESDDLARIVDPGATFTEGAIGYGLTITSVDGYYELGFWNGNCTADNPHWTASGNCNTTVDWSTSSAIQVTTLSEMISPDAWVGDGTDNWPNFTHLGSNESQSLQFELVAGEDTSSGTVNYYLHNKIAASDDLASDLFTKVGSASWDIRTVKGVELLYVDHPDVLMLEYANLVETDSVEENGFFSVQEGVVRRGSHTLAGTTQTFTTQGDAVTNKHAQDEIIAAIDYDLLAAAVEESSTSIPVDSDPVASAFDCGYHSPWDETNDQPAEYNNYNDFLEVLASCGGAWPLVAADLEGKTDEHTYIDDSGVTVIESMTYNADNTFTFYNIRNGETVDSATGTWSIANNLLTLTNQVGDFIDISAVIGTNEQLVYAEEAAWSSNPDMSINNPSTPEGEIWHRTITEATSTTSTALNCATESGWNETLDQPATFHSFTDFEIVVADCGVQDIIDNTFVIGTWEDTYTAGDGSIWVETVVYNADNTSTHTVTQDTVVQESGSFSWSIVNNYMLGENAYGLEYWAFTSQGMKAYYESDAFSDLVANGNADGEIWTPAFVKQ